EVKIEVTSVDEYIKSFPEEIQFLLEKVRAIILETAPGVTEYISYGMPAYKTHGMPLLYFAGFRKHIGLYSLPTGHIHFSDELSAYKHGKGSVQFPLDKTLPFDLIKRIVEFRVQ